MNRLFISILLAFFIALPSWPKFANLAIVGKLEWKYDRSTMVTLRCDTTANDTTWTLEFEGGGVSEGDILLIKTQDNKIIELQPFDLKFDSILDSIGHSPVTGELIEYYHHELVLYFHITKTALDYIDKHGIAKIRCGSDIYHRDIVYKQNEFGKDLSEAYKKILEEMSPDYVPPKKKTIYDDF